MLSRCRLCLGHRIVLNAVAHRCQDLIGAATFCRDEKNMPEASLIAAILLSQLSQDDFIRGTNGALLVLGRSR